MYKKTLSGLGLVTLLTFSAISACTDYTPITQNNTSTTTKPAQATYGQSGSTSTATGNTSGSISLGNSASVGTSGQNSIQIDANGQTLTNKSSDANPSSTSPNVVSSPAPNISGTSVPVNPTPSPSSSSVTGSSASQLNVVINPNLPTRRSTP